jgi:hypothetical protein
MLAVGQWDIRWLREGGSGGDYFRAENPISDTFVISNI